jgi:hypothetical protein
MKQPPDAIYIPPVATRTLLANYIKENLGCISIKQDRLMEMNFGDEMKNWDVIDPDELNPGWLIL